MFIVYYIYLRKQQQEHDNNTQGTRLGTSKGTLTLSQGETNREPPGSPLTARESSEPETNITLQATHHFSTDKKLQKIFKNFETERIPFETFYKLRQTSADCGKFEKMKILLFGEFLDNQEQQDDHQEVQEKDKVPERTRVFESVKFNGILRLYKRDLDHEKPFKESSLGEHQETETEIENPLQSAGQSHSNASELISTLNTVLVLSLPGFQTAQDFLVLMGEHLNYLIHGRIIYNTTTVSNDGTKVNNKKSSNDSTKVNNKKSSNDSTKVNNKKSNNDNTKVNDISPITKRTKKATSCMLLLHFKSRERASAFRTEFNGKPFSSFEKEICHVVWVGGIFVDCEEQPKSNPNPNPTPTPTPKSDLTFVFPGNAYPSYSVSPLVEMPLCPVCLERMDSFITGLLTTVCSHTFHCGCIMKWGDESCPVCRYIVSNSQKSNSNPQQQQQQLTQQSNFYAVCHMCPTSENLWICLVCGHVGCGRYVSAHARAHFQTSGHVYSLEMETQRVWDYVGDGYVHRVLQNEDGKLVHSGGGLDLFHPTRLYSQQDIAVARKVESVQSDYTVSLRVVQEAAKERHQQELERVRLEAGSSISELKSCLESLRQELKLVKVNHDDSLKRLMDENEGSLEKVGRFKGENEKLVLKNKALQEKATRLEKDLFDESVVLQTLMGNYHKVKQELKDKKSLVEHKDKEIQELREHKDKEIQELREQVRDLMFYLETREKVEVLNDIKGASVIVDP